MPTKMLPLPPFNRLDDLLSYDPDSGSLRWKINRSNGKKAGSIAGCIRTNKNGRQDWKVMVDGKRYYSTRVIWVLYYHEDPGASTIDHVNRDPLNNRISNLRLATAHEQNMNMKCTSPSTATRHRGIMMASYKDSRRRPRWLGLIRISGHRYSFGSVTIDSINDPAPQWLIDRAAYIYDMHDNPAISDEDLIREITR